ncbi:hypothetical protein [Nitrosopumilus ureiphilus]|uniref:Uncharacterized protein n=1 Tax=Nitrosopumilus ureiphilus TaxID=1470067 RepID=A0A7D5M7W4_9ARCH|nr:hypothetical protein [Nitrosopumilus ureiphilus]QLH06588.1 hypothetical protein C5F50_05525 [Nitrosopumilus ureiphilus]
MKKIIFFTIIVFLLVGVSITSISAQSQYQIPSWVKGVANFWVEGNISDSDFGEAITFLIDQQILKISIIEQLQNENAQLKAENLELRSQLDLPEPTSEPTSEPTIMVTISTDQDSYDIGDSIYVKGLVRNYISDVVTLVISNPEGDTVTLDQLTPRTNGLFTSNYPIGSMFDSSGTYQITVKHKGIIATSTFEFTNNGGIQNSIDVTTDKASYSEGEIILVTGKVRDLYSGTPVSVIIIDPNGDLVSMSQVQVSTDKKFSTELTVGGALMEVKGTYTITAQYGTENRSAKTTFEFGGIARITLSSNVDLVANGSNVIITGNIESFDFTSGTVSYVVRSPEGNLVTLGQSIPHSNGTFEFSLIAGGQLWELNGDYTVEVKYGGITSELVLDYVGGN